MAILDDIRRLFENLSRRAMAVLSGCERVEFVPATPENERTQPRFILESDPEIQGEIMQEELRQDSNRIAGMTANIVSARVNTPEFIGNAWTTSLKQKPIDRLYPHQCHREYIDKKGNKKKCPRNLKFEELLLAEANKKLKSCFIDKVFGYLTEHYSQFSYDVRAEWSDIFGKFEYRQYLRKLWKNPRVQFYCCACFRKATLIDVHQAFDTTPEDYLEELRNDEEYQAYVDLLQDDICEGTGLSREELFGDRDD